MTHRINPLLRKLLQQQDEAILMDWDERLKAHDGNYRRGLTPAIELHAEMVALLRGLADALDPDDDRFDFDSAHPLARALSAASQVRAARGFTPEESVLFLQACKESLVAALEADLKAPPAALRQVERLIDRCVLVLVASFVAAREAVIKRQTDSLREVASPVITLWESVLLLPLVGVVDSVRAQNISESLLEAISRTEALVTLIDVTGVPVMDTSVARHILKTVAAAEMLGSKVILTGISPSTAQTMVKLGIDMSAVYTRGALRNGLALALTMTQRRVVELAQG